MYLHCDTEFTDFKDCELISLGIVSEDQQHEFYVEITDYNYMLCSPFVRSDILPLLNNAKYGKRYDEASIALKQWIDALPESPTFIVDYGGDWQLILELLINNRPTKLITAQFLNQAFGSCLHERGFHLPEQIREAFVEMTIKTEDYYTIDNRRHHALVDAKANCYGWVEGLKKVGQIK